MAVGESPSRIGRRWMRQWLNTQSTPASILLQRSDGQLVQQALEQLAGAFARSRSETRRNVLPENLYRSRRPAGNGDVASTRVQKSATQALTATVANQDELKMVKHGL